MSKLILILVYYLFNDVFISLFKHYKVTFFYIRVYYLSIDPNTRFIKVFKASFCGIPSLVIFLTSKAPYILEINSPITSNSSSFKEETMWLNSEIYDTRINIPIKEITALERYSDRIWEFD